MISLGILAIGKYWTQMELWLNKILRKIKSNRQRKSKEMNIYGDGN
jgi:hypothetical protein